MTTHGAHIRMGLYGVGLGAMATPAGRRIARLAEELGFESLWTGEHMVIPDPPPADFHRDSDHPFLDPIVVLSYLCACTEQIRVAPGVLLLPQRHPVQLAKELASLDVLSSGRLMVGVGVGYLEKELNALGADLATRGARADECLEAMQSLWRDEHPAFSGRFVGFDGVDAWPRPVQAGGPPIMVGGASMAALRRVVRFGAGWYALRTSPGAVSEAIGVMDRLCEETGRDPRTIEVSVTPNQRLTREVITEYAAAGADRLIVVAEGPNLDAVESLVRRNAPTEFGLDPAWS